MLEAIRIIQETDYEPYKTLLFVAFSGEGLEGGEYAFDLDVNRLLQARSVLSKFELEAIVQLRSVGAGTGNRLEISAGGNLRLAELFERAARRMDVDTIRANESIDISVIYREGSSLTSSEQDAPIIRLFWEGWEEYSRLPTDTVDNISTANLEKAGRTLALSLMILGRETEY
jgi:hypothetical protein